jgi:acyl-CoA reductase-like NAD-dependent aldehyde dehydrogenase
VTDDRWAFARTEQEIVQVHAGGEEDIDDAVTAARNAFKSWSKTEPTQRGELMRKLADLAEELTDTLASVDTWNNGSFNALMTSSFQQPSLNLRREAICIGQGRRR